MKKPGYWAGGLFCLLAILSLSLAFVPLLQAWFNKPPLVQIPGRENLNLRFPGTYIGLAALGGLSFEDKKKVQSMDFWFSDHQEKDFLPINKFPARTYYSEKEDNQTPLFEVIVKEPGKYILTSDYPIGTEGPKISILLYHYNVEHIRSDLVVGVIVFFLLGGLGGYFIWATRKSSSPPR